MRAVTQRRYGGPDALTLEEVPTPRPSAGEVLVRVVAAGVCRGDVHLMTGKPYLVRAMFGLRRPRQAVIGQELAGTVVAIGDGVTEFAVGDDVIGEGFCGAFAEYASVSVDHVARKPEGMTFEAAAALPGSGIPALQAVVDHGGVATGQHVLIVGASGGVGTFAVQIAKARGATVTAVCSTRHVDTVRALGADRIVDYTREDLLAVVGGEIPRADVVIDLVGGRPLSDWRRVLHERGTLVSGAAARGNWIAPIAWLLKIAIANRLSRRKLTTFLAAPDAAGIRKLSALVEAGELRTVIERVLPLEQVREAMAEVAAGHADGKTVLAIG